MSLFGFGDIIIDKNKRGVSGPLSELEESKFSTDSFKYPMDLGSFDKGHYMIFYIREQEKTKYKGTPYDSPGNSISSAGKIFPNHLVSSNFGGELRSKVNSGLEQINKATGSKLTDLKSMAENAVSDVIGRAKSGINNIFGQASKNFPSHLKSTQGIENYSVKSITNKSVINPSRRTRRTTDAIALYMPDTLMFTQSQDYSGLTPGLELGGQLLGTGFAQSLNDEKNQFALEQLKGAGTLLGKQFASSLGQSTVNSASYALLGSVVNPMLELIYSSPAFRTFQFDFVFYPRDEKEAAEVQKILDRFRFHQVPELDLINGKQTGLLIPPSEFDIEFKYGNAANPNIPPIASCVLTTIDVNYAPNGFSAYEVPDQMQASSGGTGMPTAIQLTLQFQETTYLTKEDWKEKPGA